MQLYHICWCYHTFIDCYHEFQAFHYDIHADDYLFHHCSTNNHIKIHFDKVRYILRQKDTKTNVHIIKIITK